MLRRVVIGVAMACLMGGAAYAQDEEPADNPCSDQVAAADEAVQSKIDANALSEADAEKVNQLLDQADALCTEGKFQDASATLETVNSMVNKAK
jgi:hypothetical protein